MSKFKICPRCKEHNAPDMIECMICGEDIMFIPVTDSSADTEEKESGNKTETKRVRICEECGHKNLMNARKCIICGEDISDILPIEDPDFTAEKNGEVDYSDTVKEVDSGSRLIFASCDGNFAFTFTDEKTVVGREKAMAEYLQDKKYVSREHAEVVFENEKYYIRDLHSTNGTYVNDCKVSEKETVELHDGDILRLGGIIINGEEQPFAAYFQIRIGSCS